MRYYTFAVLRYLIMQQLYTTPQAAEKTGIPAGTIRSWLSRYTDVFKVNTHIVIEDSGRKMWTEEGISLLQSRKNEADNATVDVAQNDTQDQIQADFDERILEPMLEAGAETLAVKFFQLLPKRTVSRIQQMLTNPTPEDRELVEQSVNTAIASGTVYLLPNSNSRRLAG